MYKKLAFLLIAGFVLIGIYEKKKYCHSENIWAESLATITVQKSDNNKGPFIYKLTYNIPESTAINKEGKKILGPIEQFIEDNNEPVDGQKIRLKYRCDEPIIFEFQERIKYNEKEVAK